MTRRWPHWPPARPRTKSRKRANFHRKVTEQSSYGTGTWTRKTGLTIADSRDRLLSELAKLGGVRVIISSNLRLRGDGLPVSSQREPDDPGIAVYFHLNKLPHCLSCDTWDRAADNLAAIAKHVEAMRGQIRWGVADVATMFAGFKALPGAIVTPARMTVEEAAAFLSVGQGVTSGKIMTDKETFRAAYRMKARRLHSDANGGQTHPDWSKLQQAEGVLAGHFA